MNYYYKYKKKYFLAKNKLMQTGGNLFDTLFENLVKSLIVYNTEQLKDSMFSDETTFVHIKGGASIKYQLMRENIDSQNITNDIDLFLVVGRYDNSLDELNRLIKFLEENISNYSWTVNNNGKLYTLSVNGIQMVDITIYDSSYVDMNLGSSMFYYAITQLGYDSYDDYFDELYKIDYYEYDNNPQLLYKKTFTSLNLEKYSCIKGITVYNDYLSRVQKWNEHLTHLLKLKKEYDERNASETDKQLLDKDIAIYTKYTSDEYINRLKDKVSRYQRKIRLIDIAIEN
jgi:hypothetical protein